MKRTGLVFLGFLMAVACVAADLSRFDAEADVRKDLLARGVSLGSDATGSEYTVVASAESPFAGGNSSAACAVRAGGFRIAELRARHQIMNARGMTVTGGTSARRGKDEDPKAKMVATMLETFARRTLLGCEIVACREGTCKGRYVVALALRWSRKLEEAERASASGEIQPAADWRKTFQRVQESDGGRLLPPMGVFVDSQGYVHHVGVGFSEPVSDDALARSAAASHADLFARKNLQLSLYGDAEMRKVAAARLATGAFRSTASVYEALGAVSASGPLPPGACSLVARSLVHPVTERTVYMVAWGF